MTTGPAAASLAGIQQRFAWFSATYADLELYGQLSAACAGDPEVAGLLTAARPGQERPVLLFAAVHDLVLRRPELPVARWYASVTPSGELARTDPWPEFRRTVLAHRDELTHLIANRATQTNEVNRSVLVAVLLAAACRDVPGSPVHLIELGASAGLLLSPDRYRIEVGGDVVGDPDSPVHLMGAVRGSHRPDLATFPSTISARVGIDREPVSLADPDGVRWLEACLWPDEPWRIDRFRAAVERVAADPGELLAGDMTELLARVLGDDPGTPVPVTGDHVVVMNLWSLTYVARRDRQRVAEQLAAVAQRYPAVSWISAEPPGCVPGVEPPAWRGERTEGSTDAGRPDTVLGLRRWRAGREADPMALGWSHAHGNWIALTD